MNELVSILKSYNVRLAVKTLPFPLVALKTRPRLFKGWIALFTG